ncbi:MAG: pyridoxamine 5'-phosphate oxidase family protein [Thaumarchaeota archaeon]|nr:MAG: pyridoxamine 5'-phosphate oxidase family protein [Nitrososphaerota archaeon]TLX85165.1 MAG: pyridoxamine 5'-phosphate oxidase family protein [Nitrososphaerota archaeon]TLX90838.1 MAG: pyridoxamine 5'-phosphate oxidase family protein [Nitrososphaerota archaeon]
MQLIPKLEIKSLANMAKFLNEEKVGRVASIDEQGYPQIIPMNFVYVRNDSIDTQSSNEDTGAIYMHSFPIGQKIENIKRNPRVGFEVDSYICFLPSYYFHPTDASQADTLYISVIIKGNASIVQNRDEKTNALNALMRKYQKEGGYESLSPDMGSVREVVVLKIVPDQIRGKYKIGQHWISKYRLKMAENIIQREGESNARKILKIMGIEIMDNGDLKIIKEPVM